MKLPLVTCTAFVFAQQIATASGTGFGWLGKGQLDRNRETVISYYTESFNEGDPEGAVDRYIGLDDDGNKLYIQHNPNAASGTAPFIGYVNALRNAYPDVNVDIKRVVCERDLCVTHAHTTYGACAAADPAGCFVGAAAEAYGNSVMDIFRFDRTGMIVEHWDALWPVVPKCSEVPEGERCARNDNGMF